MIALLSQWRLILGGVTALLFAALLWWGSHQRDRADELQASLRVAEAELVAVKRRSAALEQAAVERAMQEREASDHDKEITNAITKAAVPGTAPGPASVALGCSRLRRQGSTTSADYRRICGGR